VRVVGISATELRDKLNGGWARAKTLVLSEAAGRAQVRVYPKPGLVNGDLASAVSELAMREKWKLEELHTEEGRLDEVFRSITLPETAAVTEVAK